MGRLLAFCYILATSPDTGSTTFGHGRKERKTCVVTKSVVTYDTIRRSDLEEIDKRQAELAKSSENLILEGRLSAYFVEADLKLWLMAPLDVRAQRISQRESKSVDVAKEEIKIREESEALRYLDIHNIDISNLDIYDLMINTDSFDPESITKIILTTLKVI